MIQISNVDLLEKVMTKPSMIYETKMTISVFYTFKQNRVRGYAAQRHFQQYFSYIVAVSFIGGGNRNTCRKPTIDLQITKCIEYTSEWAGFGLTTLVVIGTDCIGSCKSNYHAIMTTTIPGKTYGYCTSS